MAKLIVTRPRIGRLEHASSKYQILIDGRLAESIRPGGRVEIEVTSGAHQVRAKMGFVGSQPVVIDVRPEATPLLAVGPDRRFQKLFGRCSLVLLLAQLGFHLWPLLRSPSPGVYDFQSLWPMAVVFPAMLLLFILMVFWRDRSIGLREIPDSNLTDPQIAVFLEAQPLRLRITIRQMMIAVALLAVYLAASVELARSHRSGSFQHRAARHADLEEFARDFERLHLRYALSQEEQAERSEKMLREFERPAARPSGESEERAAKTDDYRRAAALSRGAAAGWRKSAARYAAKADYYATMRRKYEEAAARRWFTVQPDPPEPPWP